MPPVNDSNAPPQAAQVNGTDKSSNEDKEFKFTFPSHQYHMVNLAKMFRKMMSLSSELHKMVVALKCWVTSSHIIHSLMN